MTDRLVRRPAPGLSADHVVSPGAARQPVEHQFTGSPAFVGRMETLTEVSTALSHRHALVSIEGESGIGKSSLLQEVLAAQPASSVLLAICPPLSEPAPLGPLISGVRRLRADIAGVDLSPLGGALRPLFPEWEDQLPPPPEPLDDPI